MKKNTIFQVISISISGDTEVLIFRKKNKYPNNFCVFDENKMKICVIENFNCIF